MQKINFNPRAPCGARPAPNEVVVPLERFQPTRPLRGATNVYVSAQVSVPFQPTRPLRGATMKRNSAKVNIRDFNPRAPCGARQYLWHLSRTEQEFQPTRPLRGATISRPPRRLCDGDFNPRAPCGARRRGAWRVSTEEENISTHAPLAGRDVSVLLCGFCTLLISTHAPLAGRDSKRVQITMHIFAITDKFQMLLHRMPPVRAFCSFLMQENHADFGCEPPK